MATMHRADRDQRDVSERVTVVIPAHNEAGCLADALDSIIAQDYPLARIECVVVDNASTDGTARVAEEFAARHPALDLRIVVEPALGVARAKNQGVGAASGAILIFLDADSRMAPGLVSEVVACYHAGAPAGSIRVVADSVSRLERGFFDLMELGAVLFGIRSQMFYCDRALFLALGGFNESLQLAEDLEFLTRVKAHLRAKATGTVSHLRSSVIFTSPRRLRAHPHHLGLVTLFARWALAFAGIGRTRDYSDTGG
ncbi:MAG TPA: glycosyltransferase [Ktedonobacterales bacterium]|nr:glycosyltransferase [Ktedonobacterales bacterium]